MADIILTEKDIERFWSKTRESTERSWNGTPCVEWTAGRKRGGYGDFRVGGVSRGAHRVAWVVTYGFVPAGLHVLHHCDNPPCVSAAAGHLFLGTNRDNVADRDTKGRQAKGDRSGARLHWWPRACGERARHAKLTEASVREIRALVAAGLAQDVAASRFGVSRRTVNYVVHRRVWAHVR